MHELNLLLYTMSNTSLSLTLKVLCDPTAVHWMKKKTKATWDKTVYHYFINV